MAAAKGLTRSEVKAAVLEHGSVKGAAEALGVTRSTVQIALKRSERKGELVTGLRGESNPSRWRPVDQIIANRKDEYARLRASEVAGGNAIFLPDDGPFMTVILGDEHLDNPGTDLDLWERWIGFLDRSKHITGISMGDVLDNWPRVLAHLYATATTTAPEAWILFQHYMELIGDDLDASVGGNHDDWSGASDLLAEEMRKYGVLHRSKSLRFAYRAPSGREITLSLRHGWPGYSIYNEVHGIKRAARFGDRANILIGGHTHISGSAIEKDPITGRISHCVQVAAFKIVDDYVDAKGLLDRAASPGAALVIDPRRDDLDPDMVKLFWDPEPGADYLAMLRRQMKKGAA